MKAINLLNKYPLSKNIIKEWMFNKLVESIKQDESVPENFKQYILNEGLDDEKLATMIDGQPRTLFDVFDENDIVIETLLYPSKEFTVKIGNLATTNSWKTRKEAELFAIDAAFELLENNLSPKIEENTQE
jgi:predicted transcriptional regulator